VELGVLEGYSAIFIAAALRANGKGRLYAYDLFEYYEHRCSTLEYVQSNVDKLALGSYIELIKGNAYDVEIVENNSVDFIHIDLSNDGDVFRTFLERMDPKLRVGGVIIFEGGSAERDNYEWMVKYNKPKIQDVIQSNELLITNYEFVVLRPFPSVTICTKR